MGLESNMSLSREHALNMIVDSLRIRTGLIVDYAGREVGISDWIGTYDPTAVRSDDECPSIKDALLAVGITEEELKGFK